MQSIIDVRKNVPSGTIIINHPRRANAVPAFGWIQLKQALDDLHQEKQVRAVIVTGAGSVFSAGTDLHQLQTELSRDRATATHQDIEFLNELLMAMLRFPKPIIAALNGPAIGSGAALALACDFIVASERAYIQLPEIQRGLAPGTAMALLNFRVGAAITTRLGMSGEKLTSQQALVYGLMHDVVAEELVWARAHQLAEDFASDSAQSLQMTKRILSETLAESLETQLQVAGAMTAAARSTSHAHSGIQAFLEGQSPEFD